MKAINALYANYAIRTSPRTGNTRGNELED